MNHKQITLMQAIHKADRLGYIAKLSVECNVLNFYSGDPDKPATWLHVGRARVRNGCVDAVTVSLAIGRRVKATTLTWTRIPDGEYNDRPVYEYEAVSDAIRYRVVWAYSHGGTFGLSISYADRSGVPDGEHGIKWLRSLKKLQGLGRKLRSEKD